MPANAKADRALGPKGRGSDRAACCAEAQNTRWEPRKTEPATRRQTLRRAETRGWKLRVRGEMRPRVAKPDPGSRDARMPCCCEVLVPSVAILRSGPDQDTDFRVKLPHNAKAVRGRRPQAGASERAKRTSRAVC